MSSEAQEALKEILFGGAFGLCSGIVLKKLSLPFLAGASSALFFLFRAAIFEGRIQAPWSPLKIDDSSFASHLKRKARREAMSDNRRMETFFVENFYIFASFGLTQLISSNTM